jgi:hypothetical protein
MIQWNSWPVISVSVLILFLGFILLLAPVFLISAAESRLDKNVSPKEASVAPPGPGFYRAMDFLKIVSYSPFYVKKAKDIMIHFSLKAMGDYKIACDGLKFAAEEKAKNKLRKWRTEALKKAASARERKSIMDIYDQKEEKPDWSAEIDSVEKTGFCGKWENFHRWLKSKKAAVQCEICKF